MKRVIYLLLAVCGMFGTTRILAQENEAKVYFFGIGVEHCINGTPGKPNAANDVALVAKRTQADALDNRSYTISVNGKEVLVKKFQSFTLLDDRANLHNIDSVFKLIAATAKPSDIFYFYISAQSTDSTGSFIIPANPASLSKKGKSQTLPTREVLLSSQLNAFCGAVKCMNQILVANSEEWSYSLDRVKAAITRPMAEHRNQVLIYPTMECTDSVVVDGKSVSWLAGSIYKCESSLFLFFLRNDKSSGDVVTDLNFAYYDLTHKRDRYIEFTDTWKNAPTEAIVQKSYDPDPDPVAAPAPTALIKIGDVRNYALIIANEDYKNWGQLQYPVHDGEAMEKELEDYYGYEVRLVKNVDVDSMYHELDMLASKKMDESYQVLFYYSGHGGYSTNTGEGYLVPVNAPDPHSPSIMSNVISYGYLTKVLDNLSAQHVMCMIDACFSGAICPRLGNKTANSRGDASMETIENMVDNSMRTRSRCFLTSGNLNRVPDKSLFFEAIFGLLASNRQKEKVTTFAEMKVAVQFLPSHPQDGVFGQTEDGDTGEFFFFPVKMIQKK